jgi:hypothetical protein
MKWRACSLSDVYVSVTRETLTLETSFDLAEQAFGRFFGLQGCESNRGELVYVCHFGCLQRPVQLIVLYEAKAVDPEIRNLEVRASAHSVSEGLWHI